MFRKLPAFLGLMYSSGSNNLMRLAVRNQMQRLEASGLMLLNVADGLGDRRQDVIVFVINWMRSCSNYVDVAHLEDW